MIANRARALPTWLCDFKLWWLCNSLAPLSWPSGKVSAWRTADLGFHFRHGSFSRSSHTSEFKIGTPVASLSHPWHYRASARTGWPGVSTLWLSEIVSLICNFCLSVAAHAIVSRTLACYWEVKQPTNNDLNSAEILQCTTQILNVHSAGSLASQCYGLMRCWCSFTVPDWIRCDSC